MFNAIKVEVKGVQLNTFLSKKGNQLFTFNVVEPVTKFVSYSNEFDKDHLNDLAESGKSVDLELVLKGDRLYFLSASLSQ